MSSPDTLIFLAHGLMQIAEDSSVRAQVACVTSMWKGSYKGQSRTFLIIQCCTGQGVVHLVYGMRVIQKGDTEILITIQVGPTTELD